VGVRCVDVDFFGGFQIVAAYDDTCVEMWTIVDGGNYTLQHSAQMHQFDVLTYTSSLQAPGVPLHSYDATGMFVNASKPIAVYGGHSCAFVPTRDVWFCDHLVEQIPPVAELGATHVVPPVYDRTNDAAGSVSNIVG